MTFPYDEVGSKDDIVLAFIQNVTLGLVKLDSEFGLAHVFFTQAKPTLVRNQNL